MREWVVQQDPANHRELRVPWVYQTKLNSQLVAQLIGHDAASWQLSFLDYGVSGGPSMVVFGNLTCEPYLEKAQRQCETLFAILGLVIDEIES